MWCRKSGKVHRLNLVKDAFRIEQSNRIARDQASERVTYQADLLDIMSALSKFLQRVLDLVRDPLSTSLDTIVCEASGISLHNKNVVLIFGMFFA